MMKSMMHMRVGVLIFSGIFFLLNAYGIEIKVSSWVGTEQVGSTDLKQIKSVISHALDIYGRILVGPRPIRVEIEFNDLGNVVCARGISRFSATQPELPGIYIPCPLICQLVDRDVPPSPYYHAHIIINSGFVNKHVFDSGV